MLAVARIDIGRGRRADQLGRDLLAGLNHDRPEIVGRDRATRIHEGALRLGVDGIARVGGERHRDLPVARIAVGQVGGAQRHQRLRRREVGDGTRARCGGAAAAAWSPASRAAGRSPTADRRRRWDPARRRCGRARTVPVPPSVATPPPGTASGCGESGAALIEEPPIVVDGGVVGGGVVDGGGMADGAGAACNGVGVGCAGGATPPTWVCRRS